jgi:hypothetical protein
MGRHWADPQEKEIPLSRTFEDIKKGVYGQEEEEGEVSILRLRGSL